MVYGVETAYRARARVSDNGAQAVQRDGQTSHRIAHHRFHLRLGLLVAVDEAILAADVALAEASRAATGNVDGTETRDALEVRALLGEGKEIRYAGPSGIGPIDDENDPSSAFIGIYQYDANNKNILSGTVEGSKP